MDILIIAFLLVVWFLEESVINLRDARGVRLSTALKKILRYKIKRDFVCTMITKNVNKVSIFEANIKLVKVLNMAMKPRKTFPKCIMSLSDGSLSCTNRKKSFEFVLNFETCII